MKKIRLLALICICLLIASASSIVAADLEEPFVFEFPDGSTVLYYLDENSLPYVYEDEAKVPIALPLPHMQVTDETLIAELNQVFEPNTGVSVFSKPTSPPSSYVDISTGSATSNSSSVSGTASFSSNSTVVPTSTIKVNPSHNSMRFKTSSHSPSSAKIISLNAYYYTPIYGTWSVYPIVEVNCSSIAYAFQHSPSINEYWKFDIFRFDPITSMSYQIWTSPAY
jgi:hypothetical protein